MKITDWLLPQPSTGTEKSPRGREGASQSQGSTIPNKSSTSSKGSPLKSPKKNNNNSFLDQDNMPPKEKKVASSEDSASTSKGGRQSTSNSSSGGGHGSSDGTLTIVAGSHSTKHKPDLILPQAKIKVIMKSSPEIESVGTDVAYLITKATELFIDHLTTQTYIQAHKSKNLEYKHLAEMAHSKPNLEFLREIIPVKMSARDALKEIAKQKALANKELLD